MLVQILLYCGDQLFALRALAQHLHNCTRPACTALAQPSELNRKAMLWLERRVCTKATIS